MTDIRTLISKVIEDAVVAGVPAVAVNDATSGTTPTILTVVISLLARGLLAMGISKGQERSFVGALKVVYGVLGGVTSAADQAVGVDDPAVPVEDPVETDQGGDTPAVEVGTPSVPAAAADVPVPPVTE